MKISVLDCAHRLATDIDVERRIDSKEWDRIVNKCVVRATDALKAPAAGYSDLHLHHIADIFNSMSSTHRTIRRVLDLSTSADPEAVDVLTLARVQLEGLYTISFMLEDSKHIDCYLQDYWKKKYVQHLLIREETLDLKRFEHVSLTLTPIPIIQLRFLFGITDAQQATVELEEIGKPLPPGMQKQSIPQFPTPGRMIEKLSPGTKKQMLMRLYPKYRELCAFVHGLPESNLMKMMFDERSIHTRFLSDAQVREQFQRNVVSDSFMVSFFSIVQSLAELTTLYPGNLELASAASDAWKQLADAHLLMKVIWEIRVRDLLHVL